MGRDLVCARHFPDQSDRLRDALRSGERGIRRLRRVFHRHSTAARRIVPPLATLIVDLTIPRSVGMGDRVVDCARLESVCAERHRGFESLPIRQRSLGAKRKSEGCHAGVKRRLASLFETLRRRRSKATAWQASSFTAIASLQNLEFLAQLHDTSVRQDAAKTHVWINQTIAAQNRARVKHRLTAHLWYVP